MATTMFQLRSFVHQRLYTAAEEILVEVEKTITLAMYEAEVTRSKEEAKSLRNQLEILRNKSAAEPSLSSSTGQRVNHCDSPLLQENPGPSTPEASNSSLGAEVPGASQTSAEPDHNNWKYCLVPTDFLLPEIKEEQEELGGDGQTQEMSPPPSEIVKSVQDQPETQALYEMQPISSDGSAVESENHDSDDELVNSKEEQSERAKQSSSANEKDKGALTNDKSPVKSEKGRSFCHFCGKGFQYIGSLMKHIKSHENNFDCTACGARCLSSKELITHVKGQCHNKNIVCDICGKTFDDSRCLRAHKRIHAGKKEFVCQECGKTFYRNEHLTVHVRSHSGEKPYRCDICGKAFSQSQYLTIHKRSHSGEKPYQCGLCGKLFNMSNHLKTHMRYHTGEKPYSCDICGKRFTQSGQMTRHKITHTGERPYGCHICGIRYKCAPSLKVHLLTHKRSLTG